jgi:uncharacterized coiled-coil DUF342 family protein
MIDERFILSAREIRKRYQVLSEELDGYKSDLTKLTEYLNDKIKELDGFKNEIIRKKIKTKEEVFEVSKELLTKMTDLEEKEKSLAKKINEIDNKMNKLREEEINLMVKIREKYPDKSPDEIKREIHSHL